MKDYSLSSVFNTRGIDSLGGGGSFSNIPLYNGSDRNYIEIDEFNSILNSSTLENTKGVIRIDKTLNPIGSSSINPIGIRFTVDRDLKRELKKFCRGFFLVRQKRIPTTLAQTLTINVDGGSNLPCIKKGDTSFLESFVDSEALLIHDYKKRLITTNSAKVRAGICPESELRIPLFNQFFTGADFTVIEASNQLRDNLNSSDFNERYFYPSGYVTSNSLKITSETKIILVEDGVKLTTDGDQQYSSRAGDPEEAWRLSYGDKISLNSSATNIIRGNFGTYIGINGYNEYNKILNIKIPGYSENMMEEYFNIRFNDESSYSAISDRIDLNNIYLETDDIICYRGDCYIGNFTHRMHRNFQDPESPVNDKIVDETTWKENYNIGDSEKNIDINRSDVNAVNIGH